MNVKIAIILCAALGFSLFIAPVASAEEQGMYAVLHGEALGGLRINLPEKDVLRLLGQPARRGKLVFQEADNSYVQDWHYPEKGIDLSMSAGEKKTGPKTIVTITAFAPCTLATRKGIKIGSAESAVRKASAMFVGSRYHGRARDLCGGLDLWRDYFQFRKWKGEPDFPWRGCRINGPRGTLIFLGERSEQLGTSGESSFALHPDCSRRLDR
jgi:hypothetical protein